MKMSGRNIKTKITEKTQGMIIITLQIKNEKDMERHKGIKSKRKLNKFRNMVLSPAASVNTR